jgi:hypothetical protein
MPKQSVTTLFPIPFSEVCEVVWQDITASTLGRSLASAFAQAIVQGGTFNHGPGRDRLSDFLGYALTSADCELIGSAELNSFINTCGLTGNVEFNGIAGACDLVGTVEINSFISTCELVGSVEFDGLISLCEIAGNVEINSFVNTCELVGNIDFVTIIN